MDEDITTVGRATFNNMHVETDISENNLAEPVMMKRRISQMKKPVGL